MKPVSNLTNCGTRTHYYGLVVAGAIDSYRLRAIDKHKIGSVRTKVRNPGADFSPHYEPFLLW